MSTGIIVVFQSAIFLFLDMFLIIKIAGQRTRSIKQRLFKMFALSTTVTQFITVLDKALVFEILNLGNKWMGYMFYTVMIVGMACCAYYWFEYFWLSMPGDLDNRKHRNIIHAIPVFVVLFMCAISPWTHWVFYIDDNMQYQRGRLFSFQFIPYVYMICAIVLIVMQIVFNGEKYKKELEKLIKTFILFLVPTLVGSILQVLFYSVGYTTIGMSIGMYFMYLEMYVEEINENERLRSLTYVNYQLEQQVKVIQSMSKVYFASFIVFVKDNKFREITNIDVVRNVIGKSGNAQEALQLLCDNMISDDTVDELRRFVDLTTINERLKDKDFITCNYKGNVSGWSQLYFIAGNRDADNNLETVFVTSRLIHEEKKREEEQNRHLADALLEAQQANRAKTIFLNNMSHDIRTPMNAIIGFTGLAQTHVDDRDAVVEYLQKIEVSSKHLLSLINDILDMSRIESGKMVIDEASVNLLDIINDLQTITQSNVSNKQLKLNINADTLKNAKVFTDKLRLNQVLLNILGNAIKFTPKGGQIDISVIEKPSLEEGYGEYEFHIKDNGIGMSREFQKHIFEAFSRERTSTVSGIQGTGLGMAITKNIVDMMDGSIEVISEPEKGTEFVVRLQLRLDADQSIDNTASEEDDAEPDFSGRRILLVEDNEMNQEIAVSLLEEVGLEIDVADDGTVAVEKVKNAEPGRYELILMDIQMPFMDGYEATRQIRKLEDDAKANIPIVAMTANAFEEDKQKAYEAGMNAHLAKPINVPELMRQLKVILG